MFANHVITPVSAAGFNMYTLRAEHLVADVMGWFTGAPASAVLPPMTPIPGPSGPPLNPSFQYFGYNTAAPTRWDGCAPIRYAVNFGGHPGQRRLIDEAMTRLANATGFTFEDVGPTTVMPDLGLFEGDVDPAAAIPESIDVVVALGDPGRSDAVGDGVLGVGGAWGIVSRGVGEYLLGALVIDMDMLDPSGDPWVDANSPGPVLLHEFAHVLGLDHTDSPAQLMYWLSSDVLTFQPGDLSGLYGIGAYQGCLPRGLRRGHSLADTTPIRNVAN